MSRLNFRLSCYEHEKRFITSDPVQWKVTLIEPRREKTDFLHICENKGADQLRGDREADQRLCFRYIDSTIPLLSKYEISSF